MCKTFKKNGKLFLATFCLLLVCASQTFAKKVKKTELIKEEDGFYYGYGVASSEEEALALAKKDLVETALTTTLRATNKRASRVTVSDEVAANRLKKLDAIYPKKKDKTNVVYKISIKDWEKDEKAFTDELRKQLTPLYNSITVKGPAAEKLNKAAEIMNLLAESGETDLLTIQVGATELFSAKVLGVCNSIVGNLVFTLNTKNGIVTPDTEFSVDVKDKTGAAVPNLNVKVVWEIPELSITRLGDEIAPVISVVATDGSGHSNIDYPVNEDYKNQIVCLTVSTAFSMTENATAAMRKLDAETAVEGHYVYYENIDEAYKSVEVAAGEYKTGAVSSDNRASAKEKERDVTLESYSIDLAPVTNFQYAAYVYTTDAESVPEYFDNSDYNQENQPVVGITAAQAEEYAAWLSSETGYSYRLPTDDEWEVAARAGTENIYPWGDEAPNKAKAANYKGNGEYTATSPVGSFMNGSNAWGLVDMSGNVWEWMSNCRDGSEEQRTVKGGSWMDGPVDLRISNYKNVSASESSADIGFRLVKNNVQKSEAENATVTENTEN